MAFTWSAIKKGSLTVSCVICKQILQFLTNLFSQTFNHTDMLNPPQLMYFKNCFYKHKESIKKFRRQFSELYDKLLNTEVSLTSYCLKYINKHLISFRLSILMLSNTSVKFPFNNNANNFFMNSNIIQKLDRQLLLAKCYKICYESRDNRYDLAKIHINMHEKDQAKISQSIGIILLNSNFIESNSLLEHDSNFQKEEFKFYSIVAFLIDAKFMRNIQTILHKDFTWVN